MSEDPRKTGLKSGLRQLNLKQLSRVMYYSGEMCLDTYNYHDGKFCPLAVALKLDETMIAPTHDKVFEELTKMGYKVYNTRGIAGEFYTTNRKEDLFQAAREVFSEKIREMSEQGVCPCLELKDHCGVCERGFHIFCNNIPHGTVDEAHRFFVENPEIAKSVKPLGELGKAALESALKEISDKEGNAK